MLRFSWLAALAPLVLLTACATTAADVGLRPSQTVSHASSSDGASAYGLFLAGHAAMAQGRAAEALTLLNTARAAGATDPEVLRGSFVAALLSGDIVQAAALAPQADAADNDLRQLGDLTRAVSAMAAGKPKAAFGIVSMSRFEQTNRAAAALLMPLMADAAKVKDAAVVRPDQRIDRVVQYYGQLSQAQIFERQKRYDEAETGYKLLAGPSSPTFSLFLADYGEFLERRGRRADAVALYDLGLSRGRTDQGLKDARARAAAGGRAPRLASPINQISRVLVACAAIRVGVDDDQGAMAYLRLALAADPKRMEAWLLVGDLLSDTNTQEALAVYAKVPKGSDVYIQAMAKTAWTHQTAGDKQAALAAARAAEASAPGSRDASITLAELLRASDRTDEAVGLLDKLVANAGDKADWRLFYLRGTTLAQAGRHDDSERDLKAALVLAPDEPELLNYLGYMWIDRGENLPKAIEMVQRAVAQRPRSGAMIDSLGWAYYRLGDYRSALSNLERAVMFEPADPDVNDHLGDAYWKVGRRIEARFQWSRVLTLQPSEAIRQKVEAKLKSGLDIAATPASPSAAAAANPARPAGD